MKRKIIIFTVLLTNITFAYALPVEVREVGTTSESRKNSQTLASLSAEALYARGLEKNAAQEKVLKSLLHDEYKSHIMAHNIIRHFDEIKDHDIVSYVSDSALFGKRVDLSSYEHLVAFVQKSRKVCLDQGNLEKLQKISLENQTLV